MNICISVCSRKRATSSCNTATCVRRIEVLVVLVGDAGTSAPGTGGTGSERVAGGPRGDFSEKATGGSARVEGRDDEPEEESVLAWLGGSTKGSVVAGDVGEEAERGDEGTGRGRNPARLLSDCCDNPAVSDIDGRDE